MVDDGVVNQANMSVEWTLEEVWEEGSATRGCDSETSKELL